MTPLHVHVLYEHGEDGEPFGSAYARLLRPLTHPRVADHLEVSFGREYGGEPVDVVVVDRLWRPDVSADRVARLLSEARSAGACVVHALDDNFPDLVRDRPDWASADQVAALDALLDGADGFLVTTGPLAETYGEYNENVAVVPNALDERLIDERKYRRLLKRVLPRLGRPITIGYMGTFTHAGDLLMIAPAIRRLHREFGADVLFQIVGVSADTGTMDQLREVPVQTIPPTPDLAAYPMFMPWFLNTFRWDVALSPLVRSPFSLGKSDIKFLDYAALGAAGVYSRHPSYESTIRHGETGWLADDRPESWHAAMHELVSDARLRGRIAGAARSYLYAERTLERTAHRWPDALALLRSSSGSAHRGRRVRSAVEHSQRTSSTGGAP